MRLFYRLALVGSLAISSLACETETTTEVYLLCQPQLESLTEGEGDTATLTLRGRHLVSYNTALNPLLDIAVQVGTQSAVLQDVDGPKSLGPFEPLENDDSAANEDACEACETCVYASTDGCQDCVAECQFCVTDITVSLPEGSGEAPVRLFNGMGQSNELIYHYPEAAETPTAQPATPSPSETQPQATATATPSPTAATTPTAASGTPEPSPSPTTTGATPTPAGN